MKTPCNNKKDPRTSFFIVQAVNFFNEHPRICVINSFFGVVSILGKIAGLHDIISHKNSRTPD